MTTAKQNELVAALNARGIKAAFNGAFLNCSTEIKKASGKKERQVFSLLFDLPGEVLGSKVLKGSYKGSWADTFARCAFFEALRIGQGEDEAWKFVADCRRGGSTANSGAPQEWLDAHRAQLDEIDAELAAAESND